MGVSRASVPRVARSRRAASSTSGVGAGEDAVLALASDPFVARCLRRLLAGETGAVTLLSAGVAPASRRAAERRTRRGPVLAARRAGRVSEPAVLSDWRAVLASEGPGGRLRARYPWVLAMLEELAELQAAAQP